MGRAPRAAGRLSVVATPIGNLGDLSPRAAETLAGADLIAAEDTRVSARLLALAGARKEMVSYREETERRLAGELVSRMLAGEHVALVSDAGTPGISDPGYRLVCAAAEAGVEVVAVPGPSALLALLSVSGLPTDRFRFEGFAPPKSAARRRLLESLATETTTVVFYESPRRVVALLADVADVLGDPRVAVGRELTKMHEEVLRGAASEVAAAIEARGPRGEFAVAVRVEAEVAAPDEETLGAEVSALAAAGKSARDIAAELKARGVHRRDVYAALRRLRGR